MKHTSTSWKHAGVTMQKWKINLYFHCFKFMLYSFRMDMCMLGDSWWMLLPLQRASWLPGVNYYVLSVFWVSTASPLKCLNEKLMWFMIKTYEKHIKNCAVISSPFQCLMVSPLRSAVSSRKGTDVAMIFYMLLMFCKQNLFAIYR